MMGQADQSYPAGTILNAAGTPVSSEPALSASFPAAYEGASMSSRMGDWGFSAIGPNASLGSIPALRRRARTLERNNPLASKAIDSFVSNLVGTDISPSWDSLENDDQREEIEELWEDSQLEADFYGMTSFYGTTALACRSMIRDGECLGRFHEAHPSEGLLVPLQVQLLEGDHLDVGYNAISPEGNEIRYAIEWKNGRRYKYWIYRDHPGDMYLTGNDLTRIPVPVSDMTHIFRPTRIGQARGIPWLSSIIVKLHDIDQYDDFELQRKKAAALFGGFIYKEEKPDYTKVRQGSSPLGGQDLGYSTGIQRVKVGGSTFPILTNGDKISFAEASDVGSNYLSYMKTQFRLIAAGFGITYEQLSGDFEGVTYTSLRAALIEFRRLCKAIIYHVLVFQYCRPYVNRWIKTAILNGCLQTVKVSDYLKNRRSFHRVSWHHDGWDFTDPVKDRTGIYMDIRGGLDTRGNAVAKQGRNVRRVDKEQQKDRKQAQKRGLIYDTDPGQTNGAGTMQKVTDQVIMESIKNE